MPASLAYSKSVHIVFIALFVEYPWCFFFYVITCVYTSWKNRGIAYVKRSSFCFMCSISMPYLLIKTPSPLRPVNFDPHTKMPGIRPCLSRSIQMSSLCRFTSRWQVEWTLLQASCLTGKNGDISLPFYVPEKVITWSCSARRELSNDMR